MEFKEFNGSMKPLSPCGGRNSRSSMVPRSGSLRGGNSHRCHRSTPITLRCVGQLPFVIPASLFSIADCTDVLTIPHSNAKLIAVAFVFFCFVFAFVFCILYFCFMALVHCILPCTVKADGTSYLGGKSAQRCLSVIAADKCERTFQIFILYKFHLSVGRQL